MRYFCGLLAKVRSVRQPPIPILEGDVAHHPLARFLSTIQRGPRSSGRKRVLVYGHDCQRHEQHDWTLDRLLRVVQEESPVRPEDPNRTFVVGGTRHYLAISTAGPHAFIGQHPLWSKQGTLEGAMLFDHLAIEDVHQILETFYAGRGSEDCFAPYYGRFEFYQPAEASPREGPGTPLLPSGG